MMRRDILLHFYYHFGSSAGIVKVPRGGGGWGSFLYTTVLLATVACGDSSWNTQNSQKSLVFSENSDGDNS